MLMDKLFIRINKNFSTNLIFVDSSSGMERFNLPVFIFSTATPYGSLPLCVLILSDEGHETLVAAFSKVRDAGLQFKNVMTDDCAPLRNALKATWPNCNLLLCTWHYCQSWWTWILDSKHGIKSTERQMTMNKITSLIYEKNRGKITDKFHELLKIENLKLTKKLENNLKRISEWNHSYRGNF